VYDALKARVGAQWIVARLNFQELHLEIVGLIGSFERGKRRVFVPETSVEDAKFEGGDILLSRLLLIQDGKRLIALS
jgi:hypothetical protein